MEQAETVNLLISCESQARLEVFLTLFRNAGHAPRAHRVPSLRNLGDLLRDPQWDLLIAADDHPELNIAEALSLLSERGSDLPCIVLLKDPAPKAALECMRNGARAVMAADLDENLVFTVLREVRAAREHRELGDLRHRYEEIARRAELLLAASQDAIGYVVDGMHVHANELYARLFGYESVDELPSVPLVDLIAEGGQKEFKEALRRYRADPQSQTSIDFVGMRADGTEFPGQLELSTASFEGEPCMQVLVRAAAAVAAPAAAAPAAAAVGTPDASGGLDALRSLIGSAASGHLLLIGMDGYPQHCRNLGVTSATRLVDQLGEFLAASCEWGASPLRVGDAVLAVLQADTSPPAAKVLAANAVEQIAGHIQSLGSQSVTCSICVAAVPVSGPDDVDGVIDRAWSALITAQERASSARASDTRLRVMVEAPPEEPSATQSASEGTDSGIAELARQGQFQIRFQPIVSLRGDSSEYYEVQVSHAQSGQTASDWLAAANALEASIGLDKWVVIESLKKLAAHRAKHPATRLLIPVGAGAVRDPEFINWLILALRGAELPGDAVTVQLPHRAVGSYLREAKEFAERLQPLGCQLCISDVHSANNPIADLLHLKPQFARIDNALAETLKDQESTNTLLKPLIESLHQEQIASIMPRVAGASVLAVLWQLGVNFIQGDYLQSPQADMHYEFTDLA